MVMVGSFIGWMIQLGQYGGYYPTLVHVQNQTTHPILDLLDNPIAQSYQGILKVCDPQMICGELEAVICYRCSDDSLLKYLMRTYPVNTTLPVYTYRDRPDIFSLDTMAIWEPALYIFLGSLTLIGLGLVLVPFFYCYMLVSKRNH